MVTEALLGVMGGIGAWLIGLIPDWSAPSDLSSPPEIFISTVMNVWKIGNVLPLPVLVACFIAQFAVFSIALWMRLARVVVSLFSGGGGSAG